MEKHQLNGLSWQGIDDKIKNEYASLRDDIECPPETKDRDGARILFSCPLTASTPDERRLLINAIHLKEYDIACSGVAALLRGNPKGWKQIYASTLYYNHQIRLSLEDNDYFPDRMIGDFVGNAFAHYVVSGDLKTFTWHADVISNLPFIIGEKYSPLSSPMNAFLLWHQEKKQELHKYIRKQDLAAYRNIFECQNDTDKFRQSMKHALDFHWQSRSPHKYVDPMGGFTLPYILPVEIIALLKARQSKGLPVPVISHFLLPPDLPPLASKESRRQRRRS